MNRNNKPLTFLLFCLFLVLHSCNHNSNRRNDPKIIDSSDMRIDSVKLKSKLHPKDKLILGEQYIDTVKYIYFEDGGDYPLLFVETKNNKDTIGLICDTSKFNYVKGDELEIKWKIDSIRYAGDSEFLNYTEFLISSRRIKPFMLSNKKIKFLWRENIYNEELKTKVNSIVLNQEFIKDITDPEKAVLALVATNIGNECEWDGNANENRSNLKCKILWALNLGYQCSSSHLDFLRQWFRSNKEIIQSLENCPTTPDGATIQDTFDEINLEIEGNKITVYFKANGINLREGKSWHWHEKHIYEFRTNELFLINKEVSPIQNGNFKIEE